MCGRYTLFAPPDELESRFDATLGFEFEPRYNAAPGQQLPVIVDTDPGRIQRLEWGLVPRWADDDSGGHINARAETVTEKPAFAEAYRQRRCLVLADGFYEWADRGDGKRPYRVAFDDDRPFAMAGVWEQWTPETQQVGLDAFGDGATDGGDTEPLETFTVLTTEPNGVVEPLHHRMAVILDADDEGAWLDGDSVSLSPASGDNMRITPVSSAVNDPSNDRPGLIKPADTDRQR